VMAGGTRTWSEPLPASRERGVAALASLPAPLRSLAPTEEPAWPVELSPGLTALSQRIRGDLAGEAQR
jgi:hypothetical protein